MSTTGGLQEASLILVLLFSRAASLAPKFRPVVGKPDLHIFRYPPPFEGDTHFPNLRPGYAIVVLFGCHFVVFSSDIKISGYVSASIVLSVNVNLLMYVKHQVLSLSFNCY
jgi:hypothetical protein